MLEAVPTKVSDGTVITSGGFPLGTGGKVTNSAILNDRMEDILDCQTIVTASNEAFQAALDGGQEWFITKGYAPVRVTDGGRKISGTGNKEPLNIIKKVTKENGNTYQIDGLLQSTTLSIRDVLSSHEEFSSFYDMCSFLGLFVNNPTSSTVAPNGKIKFMNQYHYTIYVPTNEAIQKVQLNGWIPTIEQIEQEGDLTVRDSLLNVMERFVRYHFQDNSVFVHGEKQNNKVYLSATINNLNNKFYPINVTNTGNEITLVSDADAQNGGATTAKVITTDGLYNLTTRDLTLNNADKEKATTIEAFNFAVIHQIDNVLMFDRPTSGLRIDGTDLK